MESVFRKENRSHDNVPFLFLFTELSSQYDTEKLIRIRKTLPVGINYITGPHGQMWRQITRHTGPIEVLESRVDGIIIAIIDDFNIIREMTFRNARVYVNLFNNNQTEVLHPDLVQYFGIQFNERLSPRIPPNRRPNIN